LSKEKIAEMLERDRFLTAQETVELGFADHVANSREDILKAE
jgi:ATP-dependent protease ClpP protease subunit